VSNIEPGSLQAFHNAIMNNNNLLDSSYDESDSQHLMDNNNSMNNSSEAIMGDTGDATDDEDNPIDGEQIVELAKSS